MAQTHLERKRFSLRHNHFIPSQKLLSKTRDPLSGITRSRYEKAATPVERLLSFGGLSERSRLRERHAFRPSTFSALLNEAFTPKNHLPSVHFFIEASRAA